MSSILDTNQLQHSYSCNNHISLVTAPPLLTLRLELELSACNLEEGENSTESSARPQICSGGEREPTAPKRKMEELGSPELLPAGTGKPPSNCRRATVTQGGGIDPASQK
jgi:hypothetical protein